jgi:tripartite-type tricarboxylate transporter receptor subunit TctC
MLELGFPTISTGAWTALLAPKATPPAIIAKLNAAVNKTLDSEPMKRTLAKLGAQPRGGTPEVLAEHIASETKKWTPIVAALNLKVE